MAQKKERKNEEGARWWVAGFGAIVACALVVALLFVLGYGPAPVLGSPVTYNRGAIATTSVPAPAAVLNKTLYNQKLLALAHVATSSPWYAAFLNGTTPSTTVA